MQRPAAVAILLFAVCVPARAQDLPERLLPAGAQVYFRWDGLSAHREAFARTATGKILAGDTGKLLNGIVAQVRESAGQLLTSDQLVKGVPPERLVEIQKAAAEAPRLFEALAATGVVAAVEVRALEPPQVQLTVVLPGGGSRPGPFLGAMQLVSQFSNLQVTEQKVAGRTLQTAEVAPSVFVGWWVEGPHLLLTAGTDRPEAVAGRLSSLGAGLTAHPLYQRLTTFRSFETSTRAYVDVAGLVQLGKGRSRTMARLLVNLGLEELKSWTYYAGFDGAADRSVAELEMPGPRRGLLQLAGGKPFTLADVPPLPTDVVSWSATNFDPAQFYDVAVQAVESAVGVFSPDNALMVRPALLAADAFLGVSLRGDLLGSLGDRLVQYSSPADGPLGLGNTFLLRVRNPQKLQTTLEKIAKAVAKVSGVDISIRDSTYHGQTVHEVHVKQQGFILLPTYVIHDGWLVISAFPQPVHAYLLRAQGELPRWQPGPAVQATLAKLPKQFVSISVSDPRPTVQQLLSLAPLAGGAVRSFLPDGRFDASSIPHAHEVNRHLFENVTVVTDDGSRLRSETLASLALPVELLGLDTYAIFAGASIVFGQAVNGR